MGELTTAKLLQIKKCLEKNAIKAYRGMIGLRKNGFFQINSEREYRLLAESQWTETIRD